MLQNDLIFDLGLHHGEDTAYYLTKGYRVVAFEADPRSVALCQWRFKTEISSSRLNIVSGAISEDTLPGSIKFYVDQKKPVWSTTCENWSQRNNRLGVKRTAIEVPKIDIKKTFVEFGTPYYLKIDVEGVDRHVLRMLSGLPDRPKYLSFESDKVSFDDLVADLDFTERLGYRQFKVVQQATIPGRVVTTSNLSGRTFSYRFEEHASGGFGDDAEGPWVTKQEAIEIYRKVFADYRLIGDASALGRYFRLPLRILRRISGWPLPGWHDLHASLS
jgi:FkbM family methyltransferase